MHGTLLSTQAPIERHYDTGRAWEYGWASLLRGIMIQAGPGSMAGPCDCLIVLVDIEYRIFD